MVSLPYFLDAGLMARLMSCANIQTTHQDLQEIVSARGLQCYAAEPDPEAKFGQRSRPGSEAGDGQSPDEGGGVALVLGETQTLRSLALWFVVLPLLLLLPGIQTAIQCIAAALDALAASVLFLRMMYD